MTQDNLLSGDIQQLQFDENKNYLDELVGENKKFKDYAALAKGKAYADSMIDHLTAEQATLRQDYLNLRNEYNSRAKLEDLVEKLSTQRPSSSDDNHNANEDRNTPPQFDSKQIESLVSSKLQEFEANKRQQENFSQVQSKLRERFGNNYQSVLKSQMDELGLNENEINDLARRNPKLLYKAIGLDEDTKFESFHAPPQSQRRSDNFSPSITKRNWTYYEKMRKDQPDVYWDPKTQVQMHKDAQELKGDFDK